MIKQIVETKEQKAKKGSAMILVLTVAFMAAALGGGLLWISYGHAKANRVHKAMIVAQYTAKGGLNVATVALNIDDEITRVEGMLGDLNSVIYTTDGSIWQTLMGGTVDGSGTTSADDVFNLRDTSLKTRNNRHFRVMITSNGSTAYRAECSASYDNIGYCMQGFINRNASSSTLPGFTGYTRILIRGNGIIDSYDSSDAGYGSTYTDEEGNPDTNANSNGDIGSNGYIQVQGSNSIMVYGDAVPGAETGDAVTGDPSKVEGSTDPIDRNGDGVVNADDELPQPDELDTDWILHETEGTLDVGTNKKLANDGTDGSALVFNGGEHYYDWIDMKGDIVIYGDVTFYARGAQYDAENFDPNTTDTGISLKCTSQGSLTIRPGGKLTIYSHGTISYVGGFSSTNSDPADFQIKVTRNDKYNATNPDEDPDAAESNSSYSIKFSGNSEISALIDAPLANVKITGSNEFYGSVVANDLLITGSAGNHEDHGLPYNAKVHYDENLGKAEIITYSYFLHSSIRGTFQDTP